MENQESKKKIITNSNLILGDFMKNFETLLTKIQYDNKKENNKKENKKSKNLFQNLYQKAFSKSYAENICILLLDNKNKKKWIPLFNNIKKNINPISESFKNSTDTIFNKFLELYNEICKLLEVYFNIIKNIELNNDESINFRILYNNKSKYNIENIYSLIELTDRTINKESILKYYYVFMLNLQKTKKNIVIKNENENKYVKKEVNDKLPKNESSYNYALNKNKTLLIKIRKARLSLSNETLNIGFLFYNLRRMVQVLIILKNSIKYYYLSKNYIINQNLRSNLLTLIETLQGTISRSNELNDPEKEKNRIAIRNAFKRRFLNSSLNNNNFVHNSTNNVNKLIGLEFKKNIRNELEMNNIP